LKSFIVSVRGGLPQAVPDVPGIPVTVHDMWSVIDQESQFSYKNVSVSVESPESPSTFTSVTVGRARRMISKGGMEDDTEPVEVVVSKVLEADDTSSVSPESKRKRQQVTLFSPL
jgi:hypothetical protein